MNFRDFEQEVLSASLVCGSPDDAMLVAIENKRSSKLIAAAALVVRDRGPAWAIDNPKAFRKEMFKYLGWLASLALMFAGGGPFVVVARVLIPVILDVLQRRFAVAGAVGMSSEFDAMADDARRILKG